MATGPPSTVTGSKGLDALKAVAAEKEQLTGLNLYSRFAFAGAVCCSVTHGSLTSVDV